MYGYIYIYIYNYASSIRTVRELITELLDERWQVKFQRILGRNPELE